MGFPIVEVEGDSHCFVLIKGEILFDKVIM